MVDAGQLGLFEEGARGYVDALERPPPKPTTAEAFRAFHEANPGVYRALAGMAHELHRKGRRKIGLRMLLEVFRWNCYMATDDPTSDFKVNNNYAPHYARLILEQEGFPEELFELRAMRGEECQMEREWREGEERTRNGECGWCGQKGIPIQSLEDPYLSETYPGDSHERRPWCKPCYESRHEDV